MLLLSCYQAGLKFRVDNGSSTAKPEGEVMRVLPLGGERNPPSLSHNSNLIIETSNGSKGGAQAHATKSTQSSSRPPALENARATCLSNAACSAWTFVSQRRSNSALARSARGRPRSNNLSPPLPLLHHQLQLSPFPLLPSPVCDHSLQSTDVHSLDQCQLGVQICNAHSLCVQLEFLRSILQSLLFGACAPPPSLASALRWHLAPCPGTRRWRSSAHHLRGSP